MITERYCIECGQRIAGRSDKKFCNDQCRTAWHNKLKCEEYDQIKTTNNILIRNRRILAELIAVGRKEIRTETLTKLGFQFDYFTRAQKERNGHQSHFCYDVGYMPVSKGLYLLRKT
jgi:hypothetical protein